MRRSCKKNGIRKSMSGAPDMRSVSSIAVPAAVVIVAVMTITAVVAIMQLVPMLFTPWAAVILFHVHMLDIRAFRGQHHRHAAAVDGHMHLRRQIHAELPGAAIDPEPGARFRRIVDLLRVIVLVAILALLWRSLGAGAGRRRPGGRGGGRRGAGAET